MDPRPHPTSAREPAVPIVAPGFVAGVLAGVAMAAVIALLAVLDGMEPLDPLWPMGDTLAGETGRGRGPSTLALGLALHLLFAGAVGIVGTALLPGQYEPRFAAVMCIGFAFGVMALMTSFVLPAVNPTLRATMPALGGSWVVAHAIYGACLGALAQRFRQRGLLRYRAAMRAAAHGSRS